MRPAHTPYRWQPLVGTVLIMGGATALAMWMDTFAPLSVLALIYIAAVLCVAYLHAYRYAFASALAAVVVLNVFFVHPRGRLRVDSHEHGLVLGALLAVCLLASYLSTRQRAYSREAQANTARATRLRQLASDLAVTTDIPAMVRLTLAHLRERFGVAAIALADVRHIDVEAARAARASHPELDLTRYGDAPPEHPAITSDALRHCVRSGQSLGAGTGRWDNIHATCLPLRSSAGTLGAIAMQCPQAPGRDDLVDAQTVADMLAAAIQRERNATDALAARAQAQAEGLKNTLLASISHDFRTPLATIIGAASSLTQQHDKLTRDDAIRLARQVENEARHLAEVTENTLHWIRLSSGGPPAAQDWQAIEDVVSPVVARARLRDPACDIQLRIETGLPLIRGDAVLLAQALSNLLDNALKYSPGPISVSASKHESEVWIDVADRGRTLTPHERSRIFETFYRSEHAQSVRGAGLGLSITLAVAKAHDGSLTAIPRMDGGNVFRLALPIPASPPQAEEAQEAQTATASQESNDSQAAQAAPPALAPTTPARPTWQEPAP